MGNVLNTHGLVTGYGRVSVVHGIDLRVDEGEVVGLFGPNGAGKTTTLLTISGLVRAFGGSIEVLGQSTAKLSPQGIARLGVAHVAEDRALFTQLTVAENLRLGTTSRNRVELQQALAHFPELVEFRGRQAGLLSGGQQQMLAIARALLSRPKLLIVDEMSLGLAPVIVHRLLPILRDVATSTGAGVLFVEQHVNVALGVADRAYVMSRGKITLDGSAEELRDRPELLEASYLGMPADDDPGPNTGGSPDPSQRQ